MEEKYFVIKYINVHNLTNIHSFTELFDYRSYIKLRILLLILWYYYFLFLNIISFFPLSWLFLTHFLLDFHFQFSSTFHALNLNIWFVVLTLYLHQGFDKKKKIHLLTSLLYKYGSVSKWKLPCFLQILTYPLQLTSLISQSLKFFLPALNFSPHLLSLIYCWPSERIKPIQFNVKFSRFVPCSLDTSASLLVYWTSMQAYLSFFNSS